MKAPERGTARLRAGPVSLLFMASELHLMRQASDRAVSASICSVGCELPRSAGVHTCGLKRLAARPRPQIGQTAAHRCNLAIASFSEKRNISERKRGGVKMERLRLRNLHPAKRHDRSVFLALWYRLFSICDRGPTLKRIDACLRHDAASFLLPARAPSLSLAGLRNLGSSFCGSRR